jgi:hypothetical protein
VFRARAGRSKGVGRKTRNKRVGSRPVRRVLREEEGKERREGEKGRREGKEGREGEKVGRR